jgi:primosomal replication protein N
MNRQVLCQIVVMASGEGLQAMVMPLEAGDRIRVSGFLARANHRDGEYRLVLHAETIERL